MKIRFKFNGSDYDYDGTLPVKDAIFIHKESGVGMVDFNNALLREVNPAVVAPFMYLLMRRADTAVQYKDILEMDIGTFNFEAITETVDHGDDEPEASDTDAASTGKASSPSGATPAPAT